VCCCCHDVLFFVCLLFVFGHWLGIGLGIANVGKGF
jgi:hypothetical protein